MFSIFKYRLHERLFHKKFVLKVHSFCCNRQTGIIRTRKILDREEVSQIPFTLTARNKKPSYAKNTFNPISFATHEGTSNLLFDEASVTVNVLDVNDNAPIMLHQNQPVTPTNPPPVVVDLDFQTIINSDGNHCIEFPYYFIDPDDGPNGEVQVKLETNPYFEFRLDNSLICRIGDQPPPTGQMNLYVVATDRPKVEEEQLHRRYAIRMHIINAEFESNGLVRNPVEQDGGSRPASTGGTALTRNPLEDANRLRNQPPAPSSRKGKYISLSSGVTVAVVAILVAVSGLLCLLLLGIVITLKMTSSNRRATSSESDIT